jgi:hypothetical protein
LLGGLMGTSSRLGERGLPSGAVGDGVKHPPVRSPCDPGLPGRRVPRRTARGRLPKHRACAAARRCLRRPWPGVSGGLSFEEARPPHAGPTAGGPDQPGSPGTHPVVSAAVALGASMVQLPGTVARALPAVASHAIGFAAPVIGLRADQ